MKAYDRIGARFSWEAVLAISVVILVAATICSVPVYPTFTLP